MLLFIFMNWATFEAYYYFGPIACRRQAADQLAMPPADDLCESGEVTCAVTNTTTMDLSIPVQIEKSYYGAATLDKADYPLAAGAARNHYMGSHIRQHGLWAPGHGTCLPEPLLYAAFAQQYLRHRGGARHRAQRHPGLDYFAGDKPRAAWLPAGGCGWRAAVRCSSKASLPGAPCSFLRQSRLLGLVGGFLGLVDAGPGLRSRRSPADDRGGRLLPAKGVTCAAPLFFGIW